MHTDIDNLRIIFFPNGRIGHSYDFEFDIWGTDEGRIWIDEATYDRVVWV